MEPIVSSETSAIRTQTPGNYPKRNKLHLEHGESLKTKCCWTYYFTKFTVVAPGTLHCVFIFIETTRNYLIWTSLKKNNLTDDFFKVEAQVMQRALIVVVTREVSVNTHSVVSSFHTYQHNLNLSRHANSVGFSQWRTQEFCSEVWGGGFNKFSWGQRIKNGDLGAVAPYPLVKGSGGSCNLVQEISFHIVKVS